MTAAPPRSQPSTGPGLPGLPPADRAALLLDMDGTLLDIAPRPDAVVVPPGLIADLRSLRARTGGALAVITGRPIAEIDALLGDAPAAVAGEHGAAIRFAPGGTVERAPLPQPPADWLAEAERLVARHPGAMLERKQRGFVLHYRAAPEAGAALRAGLDAIVAPGAGRFELMPASMAWEVRPRGVDKGVALRALMRRPPFAGRLPVFLGDDVTDEDGIRAARELGGAGFRVPEVFGDAAGVRAWLAELAGGDAGRDGKGGRWPGW